MKEKHGKAINDEQIAVLADRSLQLNGPLFKSCPFCGIEELDCKGRLEDHIVGHLRSLALKSLPPIHNADEGKDDLGENEKTDRERSTVKNDSNHDIPLDFELDLSNPHNLVGDALGVYPSDVVPDEGADSGWDFMPIDTTTKLHEDAIIQHLLIEKFHNFFDPIESADDEVNQGVFTEVDEDGEGDEGAVEEVDEEANEWALTY